MNLQRKPQISQQANEIELLRFWIPDPTTPAFAAEARRQAALLRGALEETEAIDFAETVADTIG